MAREKLIAIYDRENWSLWIRGIRLLEICDHYLICFQQNPQLQAVPDMQLRKERIYPENLKCCEQQAYSVDRMKEYLMSEPAEGFLYYSEETGEPVGFLWVMFRGGNELQYRVRNIDAFGFDFFVFPQYRGRGLIRFMIKDTLRYLEEMHQIDKLFASVRRNNEAALNAYRKAGMTVIGRKVFFRIRHCRIPYPCI